jgi:P2-related tail formation protein
VNGTISDILRNSNQLPDVSVCDFRYSPWLALHFSSKEQWPSGMGSGYFE